MRRLALFLSLVWPFVPVGATPGVAIGSFSFDVFIPGPFLDLSGDPPVPMQFPDDLESLSAPFTASLSKGRLLLSDGSVFLAEPIVGATLRLPAGPLVPGPDTLAVLEARLSS